MKWNTVKEVYEHIKNPLECEDVLTFLESLYEKSAMPTIDANDFILNTPRDVNIESALLDWQLEKKKSDMMGSSQLEAYLWNLWRQYILNSNREEVQELQKQLSKITFPCAKEELKVLKQCPNFEKYIWERESSGTEARFLCSWNLHAHNEKPMSIQHQLMLNLDSSDIAPVIYEFISYCEEMKIPYYIWLPKETSQIRMLEIGRIDEWIGYVSVVAGTSPHTLLRMQEKRLEQCFHELTLECLNWLQENKTGKMMDDKEREITVYEYLIQAQTLATKGDLGYVMRQHYTEIAQCFPKLRKMWREKLQRSFRSSRLWDEKICFRPEIKNIVAKDYMEEVQCQNFFERHPQEPWDTYYLTRMLPESLQKKQVLFPNGTKGELQKYIDDVMVNYIPRGGQLQLWNGEMMRMDQFVKDIVLFQGQYQYHGDIEKMVSSLVNVERFHDFPFQEENLKEQSEAPVRHAKESTILKRMYQLLMQMRPNQLESYACSQSGLESIKELQAMELTEEKDIQLRNEMIEILQSEQKRKPKKM